jgi:hypothetical protein
MVTLLNGGSSIIQIIVIHKKCSSFNPFPDEQLNLLGVVPEQVCHFSSLSALCLGCKTISRRVARRLIVLHPKQNIENELKWQTC